MAAETIPAANASPSRAGRTSPDTVEDICGVVAATWLASVSVLVAVGCETDADGV
jgi:hypothetical protein